MRLLRIVSIFVVLCGLVGAAAAAPSLTVTDPAGGTRAFGNVPVNGAAATATVTIGHQGGNGNVSALTPGAGCAEFSVTPRVALPQQLGGADPDTLIIDVTYDPVDRSADSCNITVESTNAAGTSFAMTGTGTAGLLAIQTPAAGGPLTFSDQLYNTGAGETKNITVVNNGNQAITIADISAALPANADFTIGALAGLPIAPAGTATLPVTFDPAALGDKSGTVTFTVTNDLAGDPSPTVTISGKGTQSIATVPATVVFAAGAVAAGRNANLVVMNTGDGPLTIASMSIAAQPNGTDFKFTDHGCTNQTCDTPGVIAAGGSSTFVLTCTPSAAGVRGAIMTIASDDGTTGTREVALKCVGNTLALGSDKVGPPATDPLNVAVANVSAASVTYSVVSSVPAEFPVACVGGCAGRTLAAGASETVSVTFVAAAAGARTATLTFTSTDADVNNAVVNLTGTGTQGTAAVTPNPVAFGDVPVVTVGGATTNATITNGGDASLVITQMTITNDATNQFSFATVACPNGHTCNDTITINSGGPGNTATVALRCDPDTAGAKTANLVINSDAAASPTTIPLTCTGTVPDVVVSELMLDFGDQRVGVASAPAQTFTVTNSAAAHTAPMTYTVSESSSEYAITCTGAANCTGSLTAGQSITVSVVFTPTSAGVKADNITVVTPDDPDEPMSLVMVTGTGRLPSIAVAPSPLDIGDVAVALAGGATAATTVTNDGLVALVVSSMAITGDAENNFSFATAACANGAACNVPFTLQAVAAPANQAAVTLRCDPSTAGDKTANLVITSDAATSPTTVPVTCKGTVPDVALSTMVLDFMTQRVGTPSAPAKTFTVSNSAAAHTAPLAYTVTETSDQYAITCTGAANCTGTLPAGESITVSVVFTPTGTGVKAANITVATPGDPDELSTLVMVTGTGTEPAVTVDAPSPAPLALGDVDVNATSAAGTITLRNSGTADLLVTSAILTGGDAAMFAITGGGVGAQTVASTAGSNTHSWTVTCRPTSIGAKSTTFRVTHDAPVIGTQADVTVTCTGRAATFTPSIVAPAQIDFGQVQVGMPSIARQFRLTNTGNKAGKITMLTSTSNVFVPTTAANLALDIAPGGFIDVDVVFTPVDSSVVTGSVCGLNTGLVSPACVTVTGDGQSVGIDVTPSIDFGAVRFDAGPQTSANVTIKNTGESTLRVDTITSSGAPFTIVNGPNLPISLNLNQTTTFKVRLTPTMALGSVTKTMNVGGVFTVSGTMASSSIQASARITAPQVAMTADMIDFGMFDIDDPGAPVTRSVMITNTGDAATGSDLHIAAPVLLSGAPDFAIVDGAPATVAPGASATLTVRFDATTAGLKTGEVRLGIDAISGLTYTVTLRGQAIDQNVVCNPAMITFPSTVRLQAADAVDATVTNLDFAGNSTAATLDYSATITGSNAGDFSLPAADAAGTIAGNAMKSLPITFRPMAAGPGRSASLVINWTDGGARSCTITLLGDGRLRLVNVTPGSLDFGTVAIGSTVRLSEVASTLQLTSAEPAGATAATVTKLVARGTGAAAFTVLDGAVAKPLPTGGRVEYDIEFSPAAAGDYEADIDVFFDDDPDAQYTLHVTGRSVDIDLHGGGCDSGGGGAGALVGLAALGLLLGRRRGALAAAALALVAGAGSAQAQAVRGKIDISTFTPVASTEPGMFTVLSPLIGKGGAWALDLSFHHDQSPLVADYDGGSAQLVSRRTSIDLGFAYALSRKLELGLALPLHSQDGDPGCTTDCMPTEARGLDGASGVTLGDVAVRAKANLATGGVSFGAALAVTAPTAKTGSFAGSRGPTAHLQALIGIASGKRLDMAINAGLRARQSSALLGVEQGTDLTYGVAASYRALEKVWAIGEAYGSLGIVGAEGKVSPAQFALGVRYRASQSLVVGLGGGGGMFGQGLGSPEFRGFASVSLVPGARPSDPLHVYVPPPPPDTRDDDGDGVINSADKCAQDAEDKDGFEDTDGCPDDDNDGDGLADGADKCPAEAEDKDGFEDGDGCVDKDNDGDGIADGGDKCPSEPEDKDGYNDNDGCDDPDNDHDGVPDVLDQCALEPETINGNNDDDGCPDAGDSLVMVMQDRIEALEPVTFVGTTAKLTKGAVAVLDQIARTLRADESIKKIRVTVHVQPRNDNDQALSDRRAEELRKWLLQAGVEPERLDARGIGSQRPLVKPTAKNAEQINDRVEFIIFERRTEPTAPKGPKAPTPKPTPADSLN